MVDSRITASQAGQQNANTVPRRGTLQKQKTERTAPTYGGSVFPGFRLPGEEPVISRDDETDQEQQKTREEARSPVQPDGSQPGTGSSAGGRPGIQTQAQAGAQATPRPTQTQRGTTTNPPGRQVTRGGQPVVGGTAVPTGRVYGPITPQEHARQVEAQQKQWEAEQEDQFLEEVYKRDPATLDERTARGASEILRRHEERLEKITRQVLGEGIDKDGKTDNLFLPTGAAVYKNRLQAARQSGAFPPDVEKLMDEELKRIAGGDLSGLPPADDLLANYTGKSLSQRLVQDSTGALGKRWEQLGEETRTKLESDDTGPEFYLRKPPEEMTAQERTQWGEYQRAWTVVTRSQEARMPGSRFDAGGEIHMRASSLQRQYERNGWDADSQWRGIHDGLFLQELQQKSGSRISNTDLHGGLNTLEQIRRDNPNAFADKPDSFKSLKEDRFHTGSDVYLSRQEFLQREEARFETEMAGKSQTEKDRIIKQQLLRSMHEEYQRRIMAERGPLSGFLAQPRRNPLEQALMDARTPKTTMPTPDQMMAYINQNYDRMTPENKQRWLEYAGRQQAEKAFQEASQTPEGMLRKPAAEMTEAQRDRFLNDNLRHGVDKLDQKLRQEMLSRVRSQFRTGEKAFDKMLKEQGFLGDTADWLKNNIGREGGWVIDSNLGSDAVRGTLKQAYAAHRSLQDLENFRGSPAEFQAEFARRTEALSNSLQGLGEHMKKFQDSQANWVDGLADFAAAGVAIAGVAAAPVTGGASIALGAALGAATKTGLKAGDAYSGGRDYGWKDLGYDISTGALAGGSGVGANMAGRKMTEMALKNAVTKGTASLGTRAMAYGAGRVGESAIDAGAQGVSSLAQGHSVSDTLMSMGKGAVIGLIISPVANGTMKGLGIAAGAGRRTAVEGATEALDAASAATRQGADSPAIPGSSRPRGTTTVDPLTGDVTRTQRRPGPAGGRAHGADGAVIDPDTGQVTRPGHINQFRDELAFMDDMLKGDDLTAQNIGGVIDHARGTPYRGGNLLDSQVYRNALQGKINELYKPQLDALAKPGGAVSRKAIGEARELAQRAGMGDQFDKQLWEGIQARANGIGDAKSQPQANTSQIHKDFKNLTPLASDLGLGDIKAQQWYEDLKTDVMSHAKKQIRAKRAPITGKGSTGRTVVDEIPDDLGGFEKDVRSRPGSSDKIDAMWDARAKGINAKADAHTANSYQCNNNDQIKLDGRWDDPKLQEKLENKKIVELRWTTGERVIILEDASKTDRVLAICDKNNQKEVFKRLRQLILNGTIKL